MTDGDGALHDAASRAAGHPFARGLRTLVPPRKALLAAVVLIVALVVGAGLGGLWGGVVAVVGVVHGLLVTLALATRDVGPVPRVRAAVVLALVPVLGLLAREHVALLAAGVALAALGSAWVAVRAAGLTDLAPVLVGVAATIVPPGREVAFLGGVLGGAALAVGVGALLGRRPATDGLPRPVALRIALAVAVLAGGGAALLADDTGHVYWYVLVVVQVLRPVGDEAVRSARGRVLGTFAGALVAVLLAPVLPDAALLAFGVLSLLCGIAWSLAGEALPQMLFTTPALLLVTAAAGAASLDVVALERLSLVGLGAGVALAAVLAWGRFGRQHRDAVAPEASSDA